MATLNINEEQLESAVKELLQDLQGLFKTEDDKEMKEMKEEKEKAKEEEKGKEKKMMPEKTEKAEDLDGDMGADEALHDVMNEEAEGETEEYTLEELEADYAKLPPEDLKLHYLAAKKAMATQMSENHEEPDGDEESMPPMATEKKMGMGKGYMGKSMKKSEISVANVKLQKMEEKLSTMQKALEKFASSPVGRKAVTESSSLKKNESSAKDLTQSELTQKLRALAATPLAKNDRDLIDQYYLGMVDSTKLSHLLDK